MGHTTGICVSDRGGSDRGALEEEEKAGERRRVIKTVERFGGKGRHCKRKVYRIVLKILKRNNDNK